MRSIHKNCKEVWERKGEERERILWSTDVKLRFCMEHRWMEVIDMQSNRVLNSFKGNWENPMLVMEKEGFRLIGKDDGKS